jgi:hypothetical protein
MSRKPFVWSIVGALAAVFAVPAMAQNYRINANQKGSVLIYSKVEIKWDAAGNLTQDTFIDVSNDADTGDVDVQAYFVNGDKPLEEICTGDPCTDIIQEEEPGWNRINCRFLLTKNEPAWFSAANGGAKCPQGFTALDPDGPGRPDPDTGMQGRVLRGFILMWAVKFNPAGGPPCGPLPCGQYEEIRWNHLKGDALIVNYVNGTAWEYNAWAAQARTVPHGVFTGTPGYINLDGIEFDGGYDRLLVDFYATGTTAFDIEGNTVGVDSDLTLHPIDVDLQQDGDGALLTKAEFEVFNQNEVKLSGLRRCICCWDQEMFSSYIQKQGIPNYFLRNRLGTDKGAARVDGIESVQQECDYCDICGTFPRVEDEFGGNPIPNIIDLCAFNFTQATSLLGLATKFLSFETGDLATAGMNLVGTGDEPGVIKYDLQRGNGEARDGGRDSVGRTGSSKGTGAKGTTSDRSSSLRTDVVETSPE